MNQTVRGGGKHRRVLRLERLELRQLFAIGSPVGGCDANLESAQESCGFVAQASVSSLATSTIAAESLENRTIESTGYVDFKTATAVASISPALSVAGAGDLVVNVTGLAGPDITAVVLKPKISAVVHQIPVPPVGANVFLFLQTQFSTAINRGAGRIVFPPNVILRISTPGGASQVGVGPFDQTAHLTLAGLRDVEIDLNGSTLRFEQPTLGIRITDSSRVVIQNGKIEGSGILSTVARVLPDSTPAGIRFEVLPQYRSTLEQEWNGAPDLLTVGEAELATDGTWQLKSTGYGELFTNRGKATNNFAYRSGTFVATSGLLRNINPFVAGRDYVWLLHRNNNGHAVLLDNSSNVDDITFQDISFVNVPGMVIAGELNRGLHLNRVKIETSVNQAALLAAASDAVHINANEGDIVIENSYFGPNGDDKITIKGNYWKVIGLNRATNTLTVVPVDKGASLSRWGSAGDKVVFIDPAFSTLGTATLAQDTTRVTSIRHELTFSSLPPNVKNDSIIGNVDKSGGRVVIRNNTFSETRAQGILVQTSHVAILDNEFKGIAGPPIKLNLALEQNYESINVSNVLIRGNYFDRSAFSATKGEALIQFRQVDGAGRNVQIIDKVKIFQNRLGTRPVSPPVVEPPVVEPPVVEPPPVAPSIRLLYTNKSPQAASKKIDVQLELLNEGETPFDFNGVELRYKFTPDGLTPALVIRSTNVAGASVSGSINALGGYAAIKIQNTVIVAAGGKLRIRFAITNTQSKFYNQSNDASYVSSPTKNIANAAIDVLFTQLGSAPALTASIQQYFVQNPVIAADVNDDGTVTATDALLVISAISRTGKVSMGESLTGSTEDWYLDVNGDGRVTALDALNVINFISRQRRLYHSISDGLADLTAVGVRMSVRDKAASSRY